MKEVELLYLRDLAIKHLPESERLKITARIEEIRGEGVLSVTISLKGYNNLGMAVSAIEFAASLLFDSIVDYPLMLNKLDFGNIKGYENHIRENVQELANVAGFTLPVWLTENYRSEAPALQQEIKLLRAEVKQLKKSKAALEQASQNKGSELGFTHITDNLKLVVATQQEFYDDDFDINAKHTYPTRDFITDWLRDEHSVVSGETRRAIERIATPFNRDRAKKK